MGQIAVAVDAKSFFLSMKFMGDLHNPDVLQVRLFPPRDGWVAAETAIVHKVLTGRKLAGEDLSGLGMAIRAGNRCRVDAGGEPHLYRILIFMTAEAEKGVGRGKAH